MSLINVSATCRSSTAREIRLDAHHVRIAVFQYIEGYYNRHRPHSTINYRTPEEYEAQFDKTRPNAA